MAELRAPDDIRATFARGGVDLGKPLLTSCGTGVTASTLNLALYQLGYDQVHTLVACGLKQSVLRCSSAASDVAISPALWQLDHCNCPK
jgi:hypothetical protein